MLFCIIGPSGVGKTTLADNLAERGLKNVQSYTTRKPRYPEERGHIFISANEFEEINKQKGMVSLTYFDNNYYGVTKDMLLESDIFVVDLQGIRKLKENNIPIFTIGLFTDKAVLTERMADRGDAAEEINSRIENDKNAFKNYNSVCNVMVNTQMSPKTVSDIVFEIIKTIRNNYTERI